jgi:hypothetical protein
MKLRLTALAVLAGALIIPGALTARADARPNTTVPDVFLPVHVTVTDSRISLDRKSAHRGDEVRFTIRNAGTKTHNFTLGTNTKRGIGSQVGFSTTLKPKQEKVFLLFLDYRGSLPYRSIVKADLKKPGMRGFFKIL